MPSVTFQFVNATATNLPQLNFNPNAGWGPPPPNALPAHNVPPDAFLADAGLNATISYGPADDPHNMAYLASTGAGPTVHTTNNMMSALQQLVNGDYVVALTYL